MNSSLLRVAGCLFLLPLFVRGDVRLSHVFGDHMVLQQGKPITIWGWCDPGENVSVQLGDEKGQTIGSDKGEWKVSLPPMKPGNPLSLSVTGKNTLKLEDILIGEVWVCSGQSNMEMSVALTWQGDKAVADANDPNVRLFQVIKKIYPVPQDDVDASWKLCTPQTIKEGGWFGFSATGFYFAREISKSLNVPVGIMETAWSGSMIEPWITPKAYADSPALKAINDQLDLAEPYGTAHQQGMETYLKAVEDWTAQAHKDVAAKTMVPPLPVLPPPLVPLQENQQPTTIYNGMVHPLAPLSLRGFIWYQGESNHFDREIYTEKMKALVSGWRELFGQNDLAFYYVQIAPQQYFDEDAHILPNFWMAQTAALSIPNTGMVVINDIGDIPDIHPKNKQEVGRRLALMALNKTYGQKDLVCSGPTYKSFAIEGDKIRVTFDNLGGGLVSRDGKPLNWFEIVDADQGNWVPATATIDGSSVLVSAAGVLHPAAARFAWSKFAQPNLSNKDGFPTGAFRTGEGPKFDPFTRLGPEAQGYQVVYDIDLNKVKDPVVYDIDNHAQITKPFDRIAYFLELGVNDEPANYAFVSMDAFTDDAAKIGIPTKASGELFQQNITDMTVISNVPGVVNGTHLAGGNIEFWPNNYGKDNAKNVPNADSNTDDFGDSVGDNNNGYGSMQVHNHDAKQTILALNHWSDGFSADMGIGNNPKGEPDWTLSASGRQYSFKRLRVFVHYK